MVNAAVASPMTDPHFARMVSATTGFFFWGIMLLVAEYSSPSSTKPNSVELQRMSSSAILLRSTMRISRTASVSRRKLREETANIEFLMRPSNPRRVATEALSTLTEVPAKAAAPMGERFTRP